MGWSADGYLGWSADGYPGWSADGYEPAIGPTPTPTVSINAPGAVTAADIIKDALKRLTAYASSDQLSAMDANDGLTALNDLLDSWSTREWCVFSSNENIFYYTGGKTQYTIGNPDGGRFSGTLTAGSPLITNVGAIPGNLLLNADLSGYSAQIPPGTVVTAIGTNQITMSMNATGSVAQDSIDYSVPGDFKMQRPLRITNAFTRITTSGGGYDYPIDIISQDEYTAIGLKSIAYPWPTAMWFNNAYPYGLLNFYGAPAGGGELHLFGDLILTDLALNDPVQVPQGYVRALKWNLARELALEYGFPANAQLERIAKESLQAIKDLNAIPVPQSPSGLPRFRGGHTDAGGILYGFYR